MRLVSLTAYHARIPLRRRIKHASRSRRATDTLLVRAELDDGTTGWGEGLPREYVTGETIEGCFEVLRATDLSQLSGTFAAPPPFIDAVMQFRMPPPPAGRRDCFGNTVRCAVELAALDAVARYNRVSLSDVVVLLGRRTSALLPGSPTVVLFPPRKSVRYDGVIPSIKPWKEAAAALYCRLTGFGRCKVKVGVAGQDEAASLGRVRRWAGPGMDLRIDANESWSCEEVEARVAALRPFGITAVEQPVPHEQVGCLAALRTRLGVPVVFDESLCSLGDADRAIGERLCDVFNIRLSKCGGLINSLTLAAKAKAAGLGYQLGCMVGETGILSAAGRHFACSVGGLRYLEGSFGRHLVGEMLTKEDVTFGRGGLAPALNGPGLGVTIDEDAVGRVAVRIEQFRI